MLFVPLTVDKGYNGNLLKCINSQRVTSIRHNSSRCEKPVLIQSIRQRLWRPKTVW